MFCTAQTFDSALQYGPCVHKPTCHSSFCRRLCWEHCRNICVWTCWDGIWHVRKYWCKPKQTSSLVKNVPLKKIPIATWYPRRYGHDGSGDCHSACASCGQMRVSTCMTTGEKNCRLSCTTTWHCFLDSERLQSACTCRVDIMSSTCTNIGKGKKILRSVRNLHLVRACLIWVTFAEGASQHFAGFVTFFCTAQKFDTA